MKISEIIPKDEKDSVYAINLSSNWYRQANIVPAYKHFLLPVYLKIDQNLKYEFEEYMLENSPKWLIIDENDKIYSYEGLLTDKTQEFIKNEYIKVYTDEISTLYNKK